MWKKLFSEVRHDDLQTRSKYHPPIAIELEPD
jgi:hypothetical protein